MGTRYQDAWLRTQFAPDPDRFTVETPPDPGHGDKSDATAPVIMMDAPVLQGGGEIFTDSIFENDMPLPVGRQIDETPLNDDGTGRSTPEIKGHGYGGIFRPLSSHEPTVGDDTYAPGYGRGALGSVRGRDVGVDEKVTHEYGRPYRFHNEDFFGVTTEGMNNPPITQDPGDPVLRRGLNAYSENDGDGGRTRGNNTSSWTVNMPSWKKGIYYQSNVNRDFNPPNRTHGQVRMIRPDIVTIIGDAPPPDDSDKYASPFSSLQKFLPKRRKLTGIRRVPGPWDEEILANAPDPVFTGMSADGMVVQ